MRFEEALLPLAESVRMLTARSPIPSTSSDDLMLATTCAVCASWQYT